MNNKIASTNTYSFNKSLLLMLCLLSSYCWLVGSASANQPSDYSRPNIILIVTDDQGYADVGFNGSTDIPTPHIDRIADEGVRFDQAYVTFPVCGPSRAGFLTGRYQGRFGFRDNPSINPMEESAGLPVQEEIISEHLKKINYRSMVVGKWHMGVRPEYHPLARGFDEFYGFLSGGHRYFPSKYIYDQIDKKPVKTWYLTRLMKDYERVDSNSDYLTDDLSDQAVAFIERSNKQKGSEQERQPFFLYLAYNAPHMPLEATEKYLKRFSHIKDKRRRTYAAMVSAVDDGVGRVLETLDSLNISDNTLIFFLSDNGGSLPSMGENGKGKYPGNAASNGLLRDGKGSLYEGGLRVPFALRWPAKIKAGIDYKPMISSLDILATIVGQTGLTISEQRPLDGVDLVPFLTGKTTGKPHDLLFWEMTERSGLYVVRDATIKVHGRASEDEVEAYNLIKDLSETTPLDSIHDVKQTQVLQQRFQDWQSQMKPIVFPTLQAPWKERK